MRLEKMTKRQLIDEIEILETRVKGLETLAGDNGRRLDSPERTGVVDELRKSNQRLDLLAETASQLLRSDHPQSVVDFLCQRVLAFLDCQVFFNYLVDDKENRLRLNAFGGISEEDAARMERLDYGVGLCGCAARDGRRLVVEDLQGIDDQYTALVRPFGIKAYACHPLLSQDRVLGTLSFCARNRKSFSENELSLMSAVADHVAIALDRKKIEDKLKQSNIELEKRVAERTIELAEMVEKLQQEILERENTELELRKSQERYAIAVDGASGGIWDFDIVKGEIFFSPRWKEMLGYDTDEIKSRIEEWETRIHPDDRKIVMETREAYLKGLIPDYDIKYRLLHKNGSYRWFRDRGACLRDKKGIPYRMAGSYVDITERKLIKFALLESEKRYRELFEESKDTVFVIDTKGRLVDINPAGVELFGYTKDELLAMDLVKDLCITKKARSEFRHKLLPDGYVKDAELEIRRKDGGVILVQVSASLMHDDNGKLTGYRGIVRDITERRRLEQRLLQSQKIESIGLLAGGVAHEFNNLLTAIIGFADELQESVDIRDEWSHASIRTIQSAAHQAAKFTRGLLSFSRQQILEPRPVMVNHVVLDTLKLLRKMFPPNICFAQNLSSKKLAVMGDSGQLGQVVMNLAINARDAMPGGGEIRIGTWPATLDQEAAQKNGLEKSGDYVVISLSDGGEGMDTKMQERIFEPFFTTKEVGKGTGLGLFIVYGIVKQHNGSILVESALGKGTTFLVYLPMLKAEILPGLQAEPPISHGGIGTILIAEDEEVVRNYLESTLSKAGYRLLLAEDGEVALTLYRKHRDSISLIISDMIMPKITGRALYEEIRTIDQGAKMIFISGFSTEDTGFPGMPLDKVQFLTKPFTKKRLIDAITSLLANN